MIKIFCDKCGKEIGDNVVVNETDFFHYCDDCQKEQLTCGFKVGDQVITSTGEVGIIKDICDCQNCKKRGFYEPTVDVEIGNRSIWITNNDKRNNFKSFYKIGNQVFGNINEDCILRNINSKNEDIKDRQKELIELEAQLNVIRKLKQTSANM